jgi:thioredoxin reductase (NADPH)
MADPRNEIAFPKLTDDQIAAIEVHAEILRLKDGDYLWRAGQVEFCFFIVKSGSVEIVEESPDGPKHVTAHMPGEFTGDVDLLSGRPSVVTGIVRGDSEFVQLSASCLRRIVRERPDLSDVILRAFIMRRVLLMEQGVTGLRVIGSRYSAETLAIREFLARNRAPFTWIDLERSDDVQQLLSAFEVRPEETPVVILHDGTVLRNPALTELGERIGVRRTMERTVYDLVVVGAGPAGLAAAVYGASEGLNTLMLDRIAPGGQAGTSSKIENYMGFPTGLSGQELAERGLVQAEKFGTSISVPTDVVKLECGDGDHMLVIDGGQELHARAVILATGAQYRKLSVPGYDDLEMSGIYYAATGVEAMMCRGEDIAIVGAGNSAGQAAVYLANQSKKVWMIVRGESLEKSMSSYLSMRIQAIDNIEVLLLHEIVALSGNQSLEMVEVMDKRTRTTRCLPVAALFVFTGAVPQTLWTSERLRLDSKGFILTGPAVANDPLWTLPRAPLFLETTCPGVFAAGDVRSGSIKRVASAVGEGSMAVAFVHEYLQGSATG